MIQSNMPLEAYIEKFGETVNEMVIHPSSLNMQKEHLNTNIYSVFYTQIHEILNTTSAWNVASTNV